MTDYYNLWHSVKLGVLVRSSVSLTFRRFLTAKVAAPVPKGASQRMADSGLQALRPGPETLAGAAIPFRFEVTWRSLTRPLGPNSARTEMISKPARRIPVRDAEAKEWEMVLPRMRRPATLDGHQRSEGMLRTSVSVNTLAPLSGAPERAGAAPSARRAIPLRM